MSCVDCLMRVMRRMLLIWLIWVQVGINIVEVIVGFGWISGMVEDVACLLMGAIARICYMRCAEALLVWSLLMSLT